MIESALDKTRKLRAYFKQLQLVNYDPLLVVDFLQRRLKHIIISSKKKKDALKDLENNFKKGKWKTHSFRV